VNNSRSLSQNGQTVRPGIRRSQRGMSIIELMMAVVILTVGMLGAMVMILLAMQSNSRSKTDTTGIVLNQEILEKFAALQKYPKPGGFVTLYDCSTSGGVAGNGVEASLASGAGPAGAGATLYTTGSAPSADKVNDIDWTQAPPTLATSATPGYAMNYTTCSGDVYQVRWNILKIDTRLTMLTVSTRETSAIAADNGGAMNRAVLYALPTTLHALIESEQ